MASLKPTPSHPNLGRRTGPEGRTISDTLPQIEEELSALREELQRLNGHRFVRIHSSYWRLLLFQFARGLAFGLGTVIGATALVSIIVYSLSSIDFIPVVGEWAKQIADMINTGN